MIKINKLNDVDDDDEVKRIPMRTQEFDVNANSYKLDCYQHQKDPKGAAINNGLFQYCSKIINPSRGCM